MKKGWRLDIAYVERRERLAKERYGRRIAQMHLDDAKIRRAWQDKMLFPNSPSSLSTSTPEGIPESP
jgi:hypothetical protein